MFFLISCLSLLVVYGIYIIHFTFVSHILFICSHIYNYWTNDSIEMVNIDHIENNCLFEKIYKINCKYSSNHPFL